MTNVIMSSLYGHAHSRTISGNLKVAQKVREEYFK
jgi:hypothetical protein